MKGCRDKTQTFPHNIDLSILPQMEAVQSVLEHIFDRNASLLPAYFIANEIQKSTPMHPLKINKLAVNFVEDFRNIAQMVSVIGHSKMLPIVEHFGYTETLNPWRLDPNTLKFTFRGILPYDAELFQPQTHLLRYVLEQPYSKDMGMCSYQQKNRVTETLPFQINSCIALGILFTIVLFQFRSMFHVKSPETVENSLRID